MTHLQPDIPDKGMYLIGEAAKLLGMSRNILRAKAEMNIIECTFDSDNGRRVFSGKQIKNYWRKRMGLA